MFWKQLRENTFITDKSNYELVSRNIFSSERKVLYFKHCSNWFHVKSEQQWSSQCSTLRVIVDSILTPSFSLLSFNLFVSLANKKTEFTEDDVDPHSNDGSLRWTRLLTTYNASICSPINDEVCDEMVLDDDATNVSDFWSSMALLSHVTRLLFNFHHLSLDPLKTKLSSKHSQIKLLFRNLHETFEKNLLQFSDGYLHVI